MSMDPSKTEKGLFITLEGGDGAGKTTQINNIERFFEKKDLVVVRTREPGGTKISEKLRDILLDRENGSMEAVTEMLIYAASRAQIVRELIVPALDEGKIVICDRFVDSSVAYQAYGRGLGDMVAEVNRHATGGLRPDITFWLDIDPEAGKARAAKAGELDRLELEKLDFHYRVYEGYRKIAEQEPDRVRRIDASDTVENICANIYACLEEVCEKKGI
jgi:dTMP kinase